MNNVSSLQLFILKKFYFTPICMLCLFFLHFDGKKCDAEKNYFYQQNDRRALFDGQNTQLSLSFFFLWMVVVFLFKIWLSICAKTFDPADNNWPIWSLQFSRSIMPILYDVDSKRFNYNKPVFIILPFGKMVKIRFRMNSNY